MLLLLPPSEGKAAGGDGPPLSTLLADPAWPLGSSRRRVAEAVHRIESNGLEQVVLARRVTATATALSTNR